jgi:hypothetical protein
MSGADMQAGDLVFIETGGFWGNQVEAWQTLKERQAGRMVEGERANLCHVEVAITSELLIGARGGRLRTVLGTLEDWEDAPAMEIYRPRFEARPDLVADFVVDRIGKPYGYPQIVGNALEILLKLKTNPLPWGSSCSENAVQWCARWGRDPLVPLERRNSWTPWDLRNHCAEYYDRIFRRVTG